MLRKWSLLIGGAGLIFAMLSLFFVNRASEDTMLAMKILEQAESGATEISLSTLTDFDWEKASVYGPYTTVDVIEESLNVEFKGSTMELILERIFFYSYLQRETMLSKRWCFQEK